MTDIFAKMNSINKISCYRKKSVAAYSLFRYFNFHVDRFALICFFNPLTSDSVCAIIYNSKGIIYEFRVPKVL